MSKPNYDFLAGACRRSSSNTWRSTSLLALFTAGRFLGCAAGEGIREVRIYLSVSERPSLISKHNLPDFMAVTVF